jgi:hypothetical protein
MNKPIAKLADSRSPGDGFQRLLTRKLALNLEESETIDKA